MKLHNFGVLGLLVAMWGFASPAHAAIIAGYTFEGTQNGVDSSPANSGADPAVPPVGYINPYLPSQSDPNVTASRVSAPGAGGAGTATVRLGALAGLGYLPATENVLLSSTQGLLDNNSLTAYFTVTIAPNAGWGIDFANFRIQAARGGGSDRGFRVRSSLDGFTAELNGTGPPLMSNANGGSQRPNFTPYTISLTAAAFNAITTPIEFRFYPWSSAPNNTIDMDNLVFNGTIYRNVPEAASLTLLLAGLVCSCGARRRSQRSSSNLPAASAYLTGKR